MNPSPIAVPRNTIAALETVMAYQHPDVVARFLKSWDIPEAEAQEVFDELKKWLWLCAVSRHDAEPGTLGRPLSIINSMILVDEMWHAFILYTKDYSQFCHDHFGYYIHHGPTTLAQKEATRIEAEADPAAFQAKTEAEFEAQFSFVYDRLGAETLTKWYSDWTDKITQEYLDSIALPFRL
jgi:hypothetical protein